MRTLIDSSDQLQRKTAILAQVLKRYRVDIAALSETHLADDGELREVGSGYTIFWKGLPASEKRQSGVGFAIRSSLVSRLDSIPKGINDRLMTVRVRLSSHSHLTIISAYAPTMCDTAESKEQFYDHLNSAINSVSPKDRLMILGDFNARVGSNYEAWVGILGRHGIGNENSNGALLLSFCASHRLAITNTLFQQQEKYKTTWMHPRSSRWHMIDYAIVRQADVKYVQHTRVMRGASATGLSDHRMVRTKLLYSIKPPARHQTISKSQKLNVNSLRAPAVREKLCEKISESLVNATARSLSLNDLDSKWCSLRDTVYDTSKEVLGIRKKKHQDWFDDNDEIIGNLLASLRNRHQVWLADKSDRRKAEAYQSIRKSVRSSLGAMRDAWWDKKARELQAASDQHDMRTFYAGLRQIFGPEISGIAPLRTVDGSRLLHDRDEILERWASHFSSVLNQPSRISQQAIDEIPQMPTISQMSDLPSNSEVGKAIAKMSDGKSPGADGLPAEVFKHGGDLLLSKLGDLIRDCWNQEEVPNDFKDALIVHLYKKKGDKSDCNNHRGISLLSVAGKIMARLILDRLTTHLTEKILSESQCGFRSGRGTIDMIFSARQIQEKCREQHMDLFVVFVDLVKAFDSVDRSGLWRILSKLGCPSKIVKLVEAFHVGMQARVTSNGSTSSAFPVSNGAKQGCVLAPTLFSILFSCVLNDAFKDLQSGIRVQFRTSGGIFNLRRLQAKTKVSEVLARELLFADDCAFCAHTFEDIQCMMNCFNRSAERFGLTISLKKTHALFQPKPGNSLVPPPIMIGVHPLMYVQNFNYLGSLLSVDTTLASEVSCRISKASSAFGKLSKRLWKRHDIKLQTKTSVYKAVILPTLLYGCETWTPLRRNVSTLNSFHMRCLRQMSGVKWEDRIPDTEILSLTNMCGLEYYLIKSQFRWVGHVVRMCDTRLPKQLLYGQLEEGKRHQGGPKMRFKDSLKNHLKICSINTSTFETLASDRAQWRRSCSVSTQRFEVSRIQAAIVRRRHRKQQQEQLLQEQPQPQQHQQRSLPPAVPSFRCPTCNLLCRSKAGLTSHQRHKRH